MFRRPKNWIKAASIVVAMVGWCSAAEWNESDTSPFPPASMSSPTGVEASNVPSAPMQPSNGSRPASWPGAPLDASCGSRATQPVPGVEVIPCESARIVARVGTESILQSDVTPMINQWVQRVREESKGPIPEGELEKAKKMMFQKLLKNYVQTKLVYLDVKREIPAEGLEKFEKNLERDFDEKTVDTMMKKAKVTTRAELDKVLREQGSSLEQEKRAYVQSAVASGWVHERVKPNKEVTQEEMVTYYRDHQDEFTSPARAQWEELMVRFSKYPSKDAARAAIARMGDQVLLEHVPFAEVAKAGSDGATASNGGQRPWTTKGGFAVAALDQALFAQAVGEMGPILESPLGFHIVRVIQREEVTVKPFLEAQVEISKKIVDQRTEKLYTEYLAKLEAKTPIWTIFDSDIANPRLSDRQPLRR